jgi:site-specific DNA recombinase
LTGLDSGRYVKEVFVDADWKRIAAIWARVSTSDQRELSLDSQESAVKKILEAQGYQVPPEYVLKVDWTSLDLMSCPEFQLLRQWVADGTVQAMGTLDRDRLQAQGLQRLVFLSECRDRGVQIVTVQGVPMLEGGEGQLVELALALGKERSVLRAQQGARDGLRDRAVIKGLPPNMAAPYGMRWQNDRLVPNENYPVACEVWRMGLAGWKIKAIAAELTQRGIPTPSGKVRWSTYSVRHILKGRTYAGVVEALKTEAVEPKVRKAATYGKSGRRSRPEEERIPLTGLVERPMITEDEYRWMQERLLENKRLSEKNTKLRQYLLKGLIHCAACGRRYHGVTFNQREKMYSYYICSKRWNPGPDGQKCQSRSLGAEALEEAVFASVVDFLNSPEGLESEMQRRKGITTETVESLLRELETLHRQQQGERDAEAQAFRLATRTKVNEDVFDQEISLIRTRQRWIVEQTGRIQGQLDDIERYSFSEEAVALLRQRLETRLAGSTCGDKRFVLEAVGSKVIVHSDGSWELELQVPRQVAEPTADFQIVNSRPGLNYTLIHTCRDDLQLWI